MDGFESLVGAYWAAIIQAVLITVVSGAALKWIGGWRDRKEEAAAAPESPAVTQFVELQQRELISQMADRLRTMNQQLAVAEGQLGAVMKANSDMFSEKIRLMRRVAELEGEARVKDDG